MPNRNILFISLLLISCSAFAQRQKYNFNSNWKVFVGDAPGAESPPFNDASWKSVTLI